MVNDAKSHAEDDKKFKELVNLRNQADSTIHSCEKSLQDLDSELSDSEKTGIKQSIDELKDALKNNDKELIETKLKTLTDASASMAERVYAKKAASEGAGHETSQDSTTEQQSQQTPDDTVVDAEFEEVKDDDKKK